MGTEPKQLRQKLDGILQAIAAGRTCEQILAADRTLCYHDIFHALAEAPTSYWHRVGTGGAAKAVLLSPDSPRTPASQRSD
jgi:hypothetical protein